ncbi:hypothetical protein [Aquisalibacillus elongatus]|uniref:Uncharacterized protein n=1 Tax=Aquisalibacillus elongatus TaxID=485577 RepID=A0A3N5B0E5_9BACI|nr:hypothetical protein [Aquisalibacillus elongatus]RPF50639.1 hypothetical protein EDC24_2608 [Aquisalibacillus elongatus]
MSVTDLSARKKWRKLPKGIRQRFLNNVFCVNCTVTTVVDYSIEDHQEGIVLVGTCKQCGDHVARLIENE